MGMISREERLKLIAEYRSSGLSQAQWCQLHGFKTSKLCRLIQTENSYLQRHSVSKDEPFLIPVVVENEKAASAKFMEISVGVFSVRITENTDAELLKKTLSLLKTLC